MELFTNLIKKIDKIITPYKKHIVYPLLKILGIILLCVILANIIGGHETLSDYAAKNPDIAYQTTSSESSK